MEDLLHRSLPGSNREALSRALAEAASLAGWQALDARRIKKAWRFYEAAKAAARESRDPVILTHVTAEQTYVLLDSDQGEEALELLRYAHRQSPGQLPHLLRAWLFAAEGEVRAVLGDRTGALEALDRAARYLPTDPADPALPFLMLDETHLARWRGHCLARLGADEAVHFLHTALDGMKETPLGRAEAGLHVDLALALTAQGDTTEARKHALRAADLARCTGSARQRARIARLIGS